MHSDLDILTHPDHDRIVRAVRGWFHEPFESMGYRAEQRPWGTYWSSGMIYPAAMPPDQVEVFLADVRSYYEQRPVFVNLDDDDLVARLGPLLDAAGCTVGQADVFLAHGGPVPGMPAVPGLRIEAAGESNLAALAEVRLRAFAEADQPPDEAALCAEIGRRRAELSGTGGGLVAWMAGEPAGLAWWYAEPDALWINFLGTRAPFRRRGIAQALLCTCLAQGHERGCRAAVINVLVENEATRRLYHRLGFTDPVYRRQRYVVND